MPDAPLLGIAVGGYSPGKTLSERYPISMQGATCDDIPPQYDGDLFNVNWSGQPEPLARLIKGYGLDLPRVLVDNFGLAEADVPDAVAVLDGRLQHAPGHPAMPIQDAIDLAEFMVDLTAKWVRFRPGAPVVGGQTEIAAITKHEGFKWVRRKHYYSAEYNP